MKRKLLNLIGAIENLVGKLIQNFMTLRNGSGIKVTTEEYNACDLVYIASERLTKQISKLLTPKDSIKSSLVASPI